jgi:holin-like protein
MLESLAVLLLCQLAGEFIVLLLDWPVPGPVIGMALLFSALVIRGSVPQPLADTASGLLAQLSLLFVPAGVGVMTHLALLGSQWLPLTASLLVSTLLTIAVTGWLMQRLSRVEPQQ